MLVSVKAGRFTVRGTSLGGVYTSLHVPEADALFDVGLPLRAGASATNLFLSHGHVDHFGALPALLGMRGLVGVRTPIRLFAPAPVAAHVTEILQAVSKLHRWPMEVKLVPMEPGQEVTLRSDLIVRAFRTYHPVPSLGYLLFRRVEKLLPEFAHLTGPEIAARRRAGEPLFEQVEHHELAYATDTLPQVLEREAALHTVKTLILECTFLDDRKSVRDARAGCHIHLDDLLPLASWLRNDALVLMHFSQLYKPRECHEILAQRWPEDVSVKPIPFCGTGDTWDF